jgi:crossover junction endodeoxyribonuclease RusA
VPTIEVTGRPHPKKRPRFSRGQVYTCAQTKQAERVIAWAWKCARHRLIEGDVEVIVDFVCPDNRRGDLDNLVKLVLDALNGVAWYDDKSVTRIVASLSVDRKTNGLTTITVTERL